MVVFARPAAAQSKRPSARPAASSAAKGKAATAKPGSAKSAQGQRKKSAAHVQHVSEQELWDAARRITTDQHLPADGPLTIDTTLQRLGDLLLNGKQGSIVAIEVKTGRLLALVSRDKVNDSINRAISMTYSPGSTFKTAQTLEMVSEGTLTDSTTYPCHKGFYFNRIHIGCHPHRSPLALVQAIGQSCNSYFCKAFQEMIDNRKVYASQFEALSRWDTYMHSFGLGKPLGIDMPGEAGGLIPDNSYLHQTLRRWNGTSIMWMGMGQGEVKVTPLQLCNLAALIANRGWFVTPHIHEATARHPLDSAFIRRHQAMGTEEAYRLVVKGMRACVVSGTAASINRSDFAICGKTGTAENQGDDHSIFMGFAPMDDPKVAVSVYVENGGFGADLAAPLAGLMLEQCVNGKLSEKSRDRALRWSKKNVKITPVEVPVTFDNL